MYSGLDDTGRSVAVEIKSTQRRPEVQGGFRFFSAVLLACDLVVLFPSQYKFCLAWYPGHDLPRASFIRLTGTPIELKDAHTRAVLGEYIDIYDLKQAVDDHA